MRANFRGRPSGTNGNAYPYQKRVFKWNPPPHMSNGDYTRLVSSAAAALSRRNRQVEQRRAGETPATRYSDGANICITVCEIRSGDHYSVSQPQPGAGTEQGIMGADWKWFCAPIPLEMGGEMEEEFLTFHAERLEVFQLGLGSETVGGRSLDRRRTLSLFTNQSG